MIFFSFLFTVNFNSQAQTIVETSGYINTSNKVFPEVTYTFEVDDIPTGWTVTNYSWEVSPNAEIYIGGVAKGSDEDGATLTQIDVKFNDICSAGPQTISLVLSGTIAGGGAIPTGSVSPLNGLQLKAICDNMTISGVNSIGKCCTTNRTYNAQSYGDADDFSWTYPSSWTFVNQTFAGLIVTPDNQNGGTIEVTASITDHPLSGVYEKTANINISRFQPQVVITSRPQNALCPFSSYIITYQTICGATAYNWATPSGWTVITDQAGTFEFMPSVGTTAGQSGPMTLSVEFNGCTTISHQINLPLTSGAPEETPSFYHHFNYINYHCNKWQVCPNHNARFTLDHITDLTAEEVEYELTGQYVFVSNNQKKITVTLPSNSSFSSYVPFIDLRATTTSNPGSGTIRARYLNCHSPGEGPWSSWMTFYQEQEPEWCGDEYPYPDWCECCDPGTPKSAAANPQPEEALKFEVFPNPVDNLLTVVNPNDGTFKCVITSPVDGKVILIRDLLDKECYLDLNHLPAALYTLIIEDNLGTKTHFKILKR